MLCKIDDLEIYYEVIGEGIPVIMAHGMGVDHRTMKGCMEPVFLRRDDKWKRIYFDLPGMGKTAGVDWITNSTGLVETILAFIDTVVPGERLLLVGESYGGYLARAVVRSRPEQVEGVLLIAPLAIAADEKRDLSASSIWIEDQSFLERLDPEEKQMFDLFIASQNERNWHRFRDEMLAGFQSGDPEFTGRIRSSAESYAFDFDVDDVPAPFEKPSLILTGRQDCLVGYRDQWNFLENYPRGTFAVLDKAGHALQIEQEGVFNALVDEWLNRVRQEIP